MSEDDCPHGDESLVVAGYLSGHLSEEQARAFEAHSFACDRCFGELRLAAELRAAGGKKAASESTPRAARTSWPALGLAAAVALAVGLWYTQPFSEGPAKSTAPVYRAGDDSTGLEQGLALEIGREEDTLSLSWMTVEGADRYAVRVFTEAGDPVLEEETSATAIELSAAAWREPAQSGQAYVQVIALDELRQMIAQSEFVPL